MGKTYKDSQQNKEKVKEWKRNREKPPFPLKKRNHPPHEDELKEYI